MAQARFAASSSSSRRRCQNTCNCGVKVTRSSSTSHLPIQRQQQQGEWSACMQDTVSVKHLGSNAAAEAVMYYGNSGPQQNVAIGKCRPTRIPVPCSARDSSRQKQPSARRSASVLQCGRQCRTSCDCTCFTAATQLLAVNAATVWSSLPLPPCDYMDDGLDIDDDLVDWDKLSSDSSIATYYTCTSLPGHHRRRSKGSRSSRCQCSSSIRQHSSLTVTEEKVNITSKYNAAIPFPVGRDAAPVNRRLRPKSADIFLDLDFHNHQHSEQQRFQSSHTNADKNPSYEVCDGKLFATDAVVNNQHLRASGCPPQHRQQLAEVTTADNTQTQHICRREVIHSKNSSCGEVLHLHAIAASSSAASLTLLTTCAQDNDNKDPPLYTARSNRSASQNSLLSFELAELHAQESDHETVHESTCIAGQQHSYCRRHHHCPGDDDAERGKLGGRQSRSELRCSCKNYQQQNNVALQPRLSSSDIVHVERRQGNSHVVQQRQQEVTRQPKVVGQPNQRVNQQPVCPPPVRYEHHINACTTSRPYKTKAIASRITKSRAVTNNNRTKTMSNKSSLESISTRKLQRAAKQRPTTCASSFPNATAKPSCHHQRANSSSLSPLSPRQLNNQPVSQGTSPDAWVDATKIPMCNIATIWHAKKHTRADDDGADEEEDSSRVLTPPAADYDVMARADAMSHASVQCTGSCSGNNTRDNASRKVHMDSASHRCPPIIELNTALPRTIPQPQIRRLSGQGQGQSQCQEEIQDEWSLDANRNNNDVIDALLSLLSSPPDEHLRQYHLENRNESLSNVHVLSRVMSEDTPPTLQRPIHTPTTPMLDRPTDERDCCTVNTFNGGLLHFVRQILSERDESAQNVSANATTSQDCDSTSNVRNIQQQFGREKHEQLSPKETRRSATSLPGVLESSSAYCAAWVAQNSTSTACKAELNPGESLLLQECDVDDLPSLSNTSEFTSGSETENASVAIDMNSSRGCVTSSFPRVPANVEGSGCVSNDVLNSFTVYNIRGRTTFVADRVELMENTSNCATSSFAERQPCSCHTQQDQQPVVEVHKPNNNHVSSYNLSFPATNGNHGFNAANQDRPCIQRALHVGNNVSVTKPMIGRSIPLARRRYYFQNGRWQMQPCKIPPSILPMSKLDNFSQTHAQTTSSLSQQFECKCETQMNEKKRLSGPDPYNASLDLELNLDLVKQSKKPSSTSVRCTISRTSTEPVYQKFRYRPEFVKAGTPSCDEKLTEKTSKYCKANSRGVLHRISRPATRGFSASKSCCKTNTTPITSSRIPANHCPPTIHSSSLLLIGKQSNEMAGRYERSGLNRIKPTAGQQQNTNDQLRQNIKQFDKVTLSTTTSCTSSLPRPCPTKRSCRQINSHSGNIRIKSRSVTDCKMTADEHKDSKQQRYVPVGLQQRIHATSSRPRGRHPKKYEFAMKCVSKEKLSNRWNDCDCPALNVKENVATVPHRDRGWHAMRYGLVEYKMSSQYRPFGIAHSMVRCFPCFYPPGMRLDSSNSTALDILSTTQTITSQQTIRTLKSKPTLPSYHNFVTTSVTSCEARFSYESTSISSTTSYRH